LYGSNTASTEIIEVYLEAVYPSGFKLPQSLSNNVHVTL